MSSTWRTALASGLMISALLLFLLSDLLRGSSNSRSILVGALIGWLMIFVATRIQFKKMSLFRSIRTSGFAWLFLIGGLFLLNHWIDHPGKISHYTSRYGNCTEFFSFVLKSPFGNHIMTNLLGQLPPQERTRYLLFEETCKTQTLRKELFEAHSLLCSRKGTPTSIDCFKQQIQTIHEASPLSLTTIEEFTNRGEALLNQNPALSETKKDQKRLEVLQFGLQLTQNPLPTTLKEVQQLREKLLHRAKLISEKYPTQRAPVQAFRGPFEDQIQVLRDQIHQITTESDTEVRSDLPREPAGKSFPNVFND